MNSADEYFSKARELISKIRIPTGRIFGEGSGLIKNPEVTTNASQHLYHAGQAQARFGMNIEGTKTLGSEGPKMLVRKPGQPVLRRTKPIVAPKPSPLWGAAKPPAAKLPKAAPNPAGAQAAAPKPKTDWELRADKQAADYKKRTGFDLK